MAPRLILFPAAAAYFGESRTLVDRKMHQGVVEYRRLFKREVFVYCHSGALQSFAFDRVDGTYPGVCYLNENKVDLLNVVQAGDVVLLAADDRAQLRYIDSLTSLGCFVFVCIENTYQTRRKILQADGRSFVRYIWGLLNLIFDEVQLRRAFYRVRGIQCNGISAYEKFKNQNRNVVCYFDTRVTEEDLSTIYSNATSENSQLQIAFSGRITKIKGAHYIIPFVTRLRELGVKFCMHVYGDGDLLPSIRCDADRLNLDGIVKLHGAVDFQSVLIPAIRDSTDFLFMPNIQGDPSCTYFETLTLGTPILGFDNESWRGLYRHFGSFIGWIAPVDDLSAVVEHVVRLDSFREEIDNKRQALTQWGRAQTMERQFAIRVTQLTGQ